MNNQSNIKGNQNITIQGVTESTITLNVNGESKEIINKLDAFEQLLKEVQVQTFQAADKIYNINSINEANFGFVTGGKPFNQQLIKTLIEAIQDQSADAQRFMEHAKQIENWEKQVRCLNQANDIIIRSFVGIIGIEINTLISIEKQGYTAETKQQKYIQQSLSIVKRSLDLVIFAFLSKLWDIQKEKAYQLTEDQKKTISHFFTNIFESSIVDQIQLFKTLLNLFQQHLLELPLPELAGFNKQLEEESEFFKTCQYLQTLNENFDQAQFNLLDCFEVETQLGIFLTHFRFLVNYEMASIKNIGYKEIRNDRPHYIHKYNEINIDSKAQEDTEKENDTSWPVNSDAVLLYKGKDYSKNINLFPFVLDYNVLNGVKGTKDSKGAKIYFFCSNHISEDSLEYRHVGTNDEIYIEHTKNKDGPKSIMDMVVIQFYNAKESILGESVELNPDDVYDDGKQITNK